MAAFADSAYVPHQVPVISQDCYKGPGIGLHYETGTGVWVCTIDEQNNKRPRPDRTSDMTEETGAVTTTTIETTN